MSYGIFVDTDFPLVIAVAVFSILSAGAETTSAVNAIAAASRAAEIFFAIFMCLYLP